MRGCSRKGEDRPPKSPSGGIRYREGERHRHSILELYQKFWACPVTCRLKAAATRDGQGETVFPPSPLVLPGTGLVSAAPRLNTEIRNSVAWKTSSWRRRRRRRIECPLYKFNFHIKRERERGWKKQRTSWTEENWIKSLKLKINQISLNFSIF